MNDQPMLLTHMEDLARQAQKTGVAHSKFLTPGQAADVETAYKNRKDVNLVLDGGFDEAERRVAVFIQPDWGAYDREAVLAGLLLKYREQDTIRHQDVMGAALGLGLSREVLGDIFIEPGRASMVCLASLSGFIATELGKVGRVGVKASGIPLGELPGLAANLEEKPATVASLRIDAVAAAAFGWSRTEACEAIQAGKVQLAHRECLSTSKMVATGDIISARGKGRAKLLAVNGLSKKGRQHIILGLYR